MGQSGSLGKQSTCERNVLEDSPMQNCTSKEKKLRLFLWKEAVNHQMQGFSRQKLHKWLLMRVEAAAETATVAFGV